jgi:hypothetical protein
MRYYLIQTENLSPLVHILQPLNINISILRLNTFFYKEIVNCLVSGGKCNPQH